MRWDLAAPIVGGLCRGSVHPGRQRRMKILLLVSSFNGLTQRVWCALRDNGHDVSVELAIDEDTIVSGVEAAKPDLVICPFLKERVPARVWRHWRTIIVHPGPVGDRGPSAL